MMKRLTLLLFLVLGATVQGCRAPDAPQADTDNTLNALRAYVYYNPDNLWQYVEVDVLAGRFNAETGAGLYRFDPDDNRFADLSRCRIEASVPATATVEETDALGHPLGHGIGGLRSLEGADLYFRVVAADGTARSFQFSFVR